VTIVSRSAHAISKLSHPSLKNLWVVYKVNPEMHTHRYDEYVEGHEDDDTYQKEIEVD
jgi:hypothetical protein